MKKLVLLTMFCLAALAVSCNQQPPASPKVGVVDPNEVYANCKACTEASQHLQKMSAAMQAEVMDAQKAMQADTADSKGEKAKGEKAKDEKAKEESSKRFQEALMKYQSAVGKEQGRIVTILNDGFLQAVEGFRSKNNYSVILTKENAVAMAPDADVTKGVIEVMNGMDLKWQPVAEAKPAEPAAAPAAAPAAEPKAEKAAEKPAEKKQ